MECIDEETQEELLRRVKDEKAKKIIESIQICKTRRKRAPSKYNIFMGGCVKGKTGPIKNRFKSCAGEWKKNK